jgi:hypothetical protein
MTMILGFIIICVIWKNILCLPIYFNMFHLHFTLIEDCKYIKAGIKGSWHGDYYKPRWPLSDRIGDLLERERFSACLYLCIFVIKQYFCQLKNTWVIFEIILEKYRSFEFQNMTLNLWQIGLTYNIRSKNIIININCTFDYSCFSPNSYKSLRLSKQYFTDCKNMFLSQLWFVEIIKV